jgi:histidine phosphotransferase ChpT
VKLAYLMMLCAESALPMGGELRCRWNRAGNGRLPPIADRVAVEEALWSVLRFGPGASGRPLRPAEVHFLALHDAAEAMARTLNYVHDDRQLRLTTA